MKSAIIVAAGMSKRMGPDVDKAFLTLGTRPVLAYSLTAFEKCPDIDSVVLVVRKDRVEAARNLVQMFGCAKVRSVVAGGARRQDSVAAGMAELHDETKIVVVHDGGRPCVSPQTISDTVASAKKYGSGVAAVKVTDTIKSVERGMTVSATVDRTKLWAVQTPQAFKKDLLNKALDFVAKKKLQVTDEASAVEAIDGKVQLVQSALSNIKITTPDDLLIAAALLKL